MDEDMATVTSKGQLVVPVRLRRKYGISRGTRVRFLDRDGELVMQPITAAYIRSIRGLLESKTSVTRELLAERARDRAREDRKGGGRRSG